MLFIGFAVILSLCLCLWVAGAYSRGVLSILNGTIDMDTTALKQMLLKSTYAYDPDQSSLTTPAASECDATGYTGGFNGADRLAATITLTEQTANNRVVTIITDTTWTAIGGATNNTLGSAVLMREITNDAASIPIAYLEFASALPTNGSDVLVDYDGTNGNIRWTV
jgi:hypothetical protein